MCDDCKTDTANPVSRRVNRSLDVETQGQAGYACEMSDEAKVREIFTYHSPTPYTTPKFEAIRAAGKYFAEVLLANVPRGADRTAAIRKLREAVMTANAGISLDGLSI